jgi:hypothetical protein
VCGHILGDIPLFQLKKPIEYGCVYFGILGLVVRMGCFVNGFHEFDSKTEWLLFEFGRS